MVLISKSSNRRNIYVGNQEKNVNIHQLENNHTYFNVRDSHYGAAGSWLAVGSDRNNFGKA